jgi:hypothetical protein
MVHTNREMLLSKCNNAFKCTHDQYTNTAYNDALFVHVLLSCCFWFSVTPLQDACWSYIRA